ncbi:J domain-containing protein [Candidatus Endowatersipora endosymbiont of Watersipora subatra]|uniref:J domain-containing protein n=1 Tax=Candidatus Endowatersipora endosymbiont of Watersipora subatra TaxID=3077946 RepID=UPI00312CAB69
MTSNSDIFDKIRIYPRRSKKKKEKDAMKVCAWNGCDKPGTHKAPMGRSYEGQYLNMCIDHVRLYNKNFNYFLGLNDEEIANCQKENMTDYLPTWKIGTGINGKRGESIIDSDSSKLRPTPSWHATVRIRYSSDGKRISSGKDSRKLKRLEEKALRDLELPTTVNSDHITKKYKALVKQHHPDTNGGDRSSEDRLRQIIRAYKQLKQSGLC